MAIEIRERFEVDAPVGEVWQFLLDPHRVITAMPGAELDEVVDEQTFQGRVRVRLGAITTSYRGRVTLSDVDAESHDLRMLAEGREAGGGTARGTMSGRLRALEGGRTEVLAEAQVELTGRVVQMGRGLVQGVAQQLFAEFASRTRAHLEGASPGAAVGGDDALPENAPIRALPLMLRALWAAIVRFFRRSGRNAGT